MDVAESHHLSSAHTWAPVYHLPSLSGNPAPQGVVGQSGSTRFNYEAAGGGGRKTHDSTNRDPAPPTVRAAYS